MSAIRPSRTPRVLGAEESSASRLSFRGQRAMPKLQAVQEHADALRKTINRLRKN